MLMKAAKTYPRKFQKNLKAVCPQIVYPVCLRILYPSTPLPLYPSIPLPLYPFIPFAFQSESRRTDEDSASARLGGATTYPVEMEMKLPPCIADIQHPASVHGLQ